MNADSVTGTPQKKVRKSSGRKFYKTFVRFGNTEEMYLLDKNYVGLSVLGKGAYGTVVSATNTDTGEKVAIKKVANAFCDCSDAKRTLREIKMLMHLDHPNVCKIIDLIPPFGKEFQDVYLVLKQMDVDLHRVIYSSQKLAHNHIKYFAYQIAKAMNYIHSSGIVHRDLKPSNILVNENCSIKICDFGLARACADGLWAMDKSQYVVTRWYRAPELLCYYDGYDKAVDNWSMGCILAELYDREALFNGKNYRKTLEKILLTVGAPSFQDLLDIKREKNVYVTEKEDKNYSHNRDALQFCRQRKHWRGVNFSNRFNHAGSDGADLIRRLLQFNPRKRITTDEVLEHPYLSAWRIPETEVICKEKFDESYELTCFKASDIKDITYDVVMGFRNNKAEKGKSLKKSSSAIANFSSPTDRKKAPSTPTKEGQKKKGKTKPRSYSAPVKSTTRDVRTKSGKNKSISASYAEAYKNHPNKKKNNSSSSSCTNNKVAKKSSNVTTKSKNHHHHGSNNGYYGQKKPVATAKFSKYKKIRSKTISNSSSSSSSESNTTKKDAIRNVRGREMKNKASYCRPKNKQNE